MNAAKLPMFCLRPHHWLLPSVDTAIMLLARPSCDDVQLQAKEIQLLASTGLIARQKLMPAQQAPRRPGQHGDFQALAWLEVLGTTRTRCSNRDSDSDSGNDFLQMDPWHHCFSAAGSAAAAMGRPLRLTALNVLLLDSLPNDVQLAHLVSALRRPPSKTDRLG
jgi:hypothetical protein